MSEKIVAEFLNKSMRALMVFLAQFEILCGGLSRRYDAC